MRVQVKERLTRALRAAWSAPCRAFNWWLDNIGGCVGCMWSGGCGDCQRCGLYAEEAAVRRARRRT